MARLRAHARHDAVMQSFQENRFPTLLDIDPSAARCETAPRLLEISNSHVCVQGYAHFAGLLHRSSLQPSGHCSS
jgi:hypothetical protein